MKIENLKVDKQYLDDNPHCVFVYGDNLIHKGHGGAAYLRDHPRAVGFVTKKYPDNRDSSFYKPEEYEQIFWACVKELKNRIARSPNTTFLISKLGAGLANRYGIWESIIKPNLANELVMFDNVVLLWDGPTCYGGVSY